MFWIYCCVVTSCTSEVVLLKEDFHQLQQVFNLTLQWWYSHTPEMYFVVVQYILLSLLVCLYDVSEGNSALRLLCFIFFPCNKLQDWGHPCCNAAWLSIALSPEYSSDNPASHTGLTDNVFSLHWSLQTQAIALDSAAVWIKQIEPGFVFSFEYELKDPSERN